MSWICRNCETENPDILDICEVCETHAPKIVGFKYDKVRSGKPIIISWKAENCDKVSIFYNGETIDASGENSYSIEKPEAPNISFILSSDVTTRTICYTMDFIKGPSIEIKADRIKLRKGYGESAILSWNIENAKRAVLISGDKEFEILLIGKQEINPEYSTIYVIKALALDEETIFEERLQIGVYDECTIEFKADKYYIYPTIPVTLSWNVTNAKSVRLNSESIEVSGTKVIEPEKATTYILSAEDEFSIKEKRIDIQMLPIPQVKTLLVPMPNLTSNLSIHITQPKYSVGVRFPTINIGWTKMEIPKVPSLTDLGINAELSPLLPEFNLKRTIKNMFNRIKKK